MKKIWMEILCISLCLGLSGCALVINPGNSDVEAKDDTDEVKIVYRDEEPDNKIYDRNEECSKGVRIILYHQYGPNMVYDTKTVVGAAANTLIALIEGLEETGEKEAKISDEKADWDSYYLPNISAESGTMWIEIGDDLYRTSWDYDTICRVEKPLGEGVVLNLSEECATEISDVWYYYPCDYWSGTYENGELRIGHLYAADTDVTAIVKKLEFGSKENIIELDVTSSVEQKMIIHWESSNGGDCLGTIDSEEFEFKAGETKRIQLKFEGLWFNRPYRYWLEIHMGNTKLSIAIDVEK